MFHIVCHMVVTWYVIKMMADVENTLNENEFFEDTVDTPKEGVEQHRKRECLKDAIKEGKVLGSKKQWTVRKAYEASEATITSHVS